MNPYPGLRPFEASERAWFTGRDLALAQAATRLRFAPLTLIFARSGIGKSSFLTCRLMPEVGKRTTIAYVNEWGGSPPEIIVRERARTLVERSDADGVERDERPLLVLDQFEDVFKSGRDRAALWDQLAELVNVSEPAVNVVVSMREEWLGAWGESSDYLPEGHNNYVRLAPLSEAELLRAILRPAEIEGTHRVEPALARRLLEDLRTSNAFGLGENDVEPAILQLVCNRLWREADGRGRVVIDGELYAACGSAERMIRDFVWDRLGDVSSNGALFTPLDRVLWAGLTRHLLAAPGVKAIVTPTILASKLQLADLGIVGRAVVSKTLPWSARSYLERKPNRREAPPPSIVAWIATVLGKGTTAGFLKRQAGFDGHESLYELTHDRLGAILLAFATEFERVIRKRWYAFAAIASLLMLVPLTAYAIPHLDLRERYGPFTIVVAAFAIVFAVGFEIAIFWAMYRLSKTVFGLVCYPLIRRFTLGRVVPRDGRSRER